MKWVGSLLVSVVVLAGCGGDVSRPATVATVVTTSTSTTTVVTIPATFPRPVDELGLRCQAVVDVLLGELKAQGKAPAAAEVICRDASVDPLLAGRGGYTLGMIARVKYPWPNLPEYQWDRGWRDVAAHEIGHTFARTLTDAQKARFGEISGRGVWDEEWFADYYAAVIGGVGRGALAYIGVPPPTEQINVLCEERILPC